MAQWSPSDCGLGNACACMHPNTQALQQACTGTVLTAKRLRIRQLIAPRTSMQASALLWLVFAPVQRLGTLPAPEVEPQTQPTPYSIKYKSMARMPCTPLPSRRLPSPSSPSYWHRRSHAGICARHARLPTQARRAAWGAAADGPGPLPAVSQACQPRTPGQRKYVRNASIKSGSNGAERVPMPRRKLLPDGLGRNPFQHMM